MDDLISRQAAIDAMTECYWSIMGDEPPKLDEKTALYVDLKQAVKRLPTAEPELANNSPKVENGNGELISRQAAIDAADRADYTGLAVEDVKKVTDEVVKELKKLPSAQPEQRWIPCNERLPGESGRYLVTRGLNACGSLWNRIYIANYSDLMGIKKESIWWQGNVGKSDFEQLDDVLAWMPLPKPYEEESDEADKREE